MLKSKRKKIFYFLYLLGLAFIVSLGTVIITDAKFSFKEPLGIGVFTVYLLLLAYITYWFYKQLTSITIDKKSITFKKPLSSSVRISFTEIVSIQLTGKIPDANISSNFSADGTRIKLLDGRQFYFSDAVYSNVWQLKTALKELVIDKRPEFEIPKETVLHSDVALDNVEVFKGSFSFSEFMFWGFLALIIFAVLRNQQNPHMQKVLPFLSIAILIYFLTTSYILNFFTLTENYLVIKNRYFFWLKQIYSLSDIEEVVIDRNTRTPIFMKVTTKSFKNKLFYGASLRKKNWLELKHALESKGVRVRNECIGE